MEDDSSNQTQPEKNELLEEIKAKAGTLLSQINQIAESCQIQENSIKEKTQGVIQKTETLTQEQGKIEGLLQKITQTQQDVISQKNSTDVIVQAVQEKQTAINTAANEIQKTKTVVDSNDKTIQKCKTSVEEVKQSAAQSKTNIDANEKAILQSKTVVDSNEKAIQQSKANVGLLETKLNVIADTADKKVKTVESFKAELDELNEKWINKFQAEFNRNKKSFDESQQQHSEEYEALKKKIENLLPGATSVGLAKAFMERKNSIEKQKNFWRNMTIFGAAGLVLFGILAIFFPPKITNGLYEFLLYILTRSSILVGIVMIEEFGRRHFNIISRLAETYAYKEVLSSSFEGYKKQMETIELESTITTTDTDTAGKETKKTVPIKASSKLSDNLLDNLGEDPSNIYEKEKPVPAPIVDIPELAALSINKAVEHLKKNKFDIGWRVFGIALALIIATATSIILLVK